MRWTRGQQRLVERGLHKVTCPYPDSHREAYAVFTLRLTVLPESNLLTCHRGLGRRRHMVLSIAQDRVAFKYSGGELLSGKEGESKPEQGWRLCDVGTATGPPLRASSTSYCELGQVFLPKGNCHVSSCILFQSNTSGVLSANRFREMCNGVTKF